MRTTQCHTAPQHHTPKQYLSQGPAGALQVPAPSGIVPSLCKPITHYALRTMCTQRSLVQGLVGTQAASEQSCVWAALRLCPLAPAGTINTLYISLCERNHQTSL
jgi:hypothetical protein